MVTKNQIQSARKADLYDFLSTHYPDQYVVISGSLRPVFNHSVSIKKGYSGYVDFANGDHGNSIDFLTKYLGYSFTDAVAALTGSNTLCAVPSTFISCDLSQNKKRTLHMPPPDSTNDSVIKYLVNIRGLSADTIQKVLTDRILYQDQRNNAIFLNKEKDWGELRGTGKQYFHGIVAGSRHDGFWYFIPNSEVLFPCYICEAAIDSLSLYELRRQQGKVGGVYISIGGAGKQAAIERLKRGKRKLVIATDADETGDATRKRNPELETIRPQHGKDWNEMLLI